MLMPDHPIHNRNPVAVSFLGFQGLVDGLLG